jgi:two-component system phosphate regulon response regulator PhoB
MPDRHRILIVDDSDEVVAFYTEVLEANGYEYAVARNGREAIEAMKASPPELVLLDVMMPRKSGIAVFQQMKKDPNLEKIPIVIITGASEVTGVDMRSGSEQPKQTYDDDLTREFGAQLREKLQSLTPDAFLEKPVEPEALVAKIESLLGPRSGGA